VYLTLPIPAASLLVLMAWNAAAARNRAITQLTEQLANGTQAEAVAAIRGLAAMRRPPMEILVSTATSRDQAIAVEARLAIGEALRSCRQQIQSQRRLNDVAEQLAELAASLAEERTSFPPDAAAWVARTAKETLRLANQLPSGITPALAAHCDKILEDTQSLLAAPTSVLQRPAPFPPAVPAEDNAAVPRGHAFSSMQLLPQTPTRDDQFVASMPADTTPLQPRPSTDAAIDANRPNDAPKSLWQPQWSSTMGSAPRDSNDERTASPPSTVTNGKAARPATAPGTDQHVEPLNNASDRQLLQQLRTANDVTAATIQIELARRGFGRVTPPMAEQFFSAQQTQRIDLIDDLLNHPDAGIRPWLLLLAEDAQADVRLAAIVVMATSNDRQLLDQAYEVAIRDTDGRIADLAARLHERRSRAPRR
jgi:hypothetical protein